MKPGVWEPIETARKDGIRIKLCAFYGDEMLNICICHWYNGYWNDWDFVVGPTHWCEC